MICYKDKTFCSFYETCAKQNDCSRPLTAQVKDDAVKWWGGEGAPIAVFADKPQCHSDNQEKKEP